MFKWWGGLNREFKLLLLVWMFIGITQGLYDTTFNNYLNDIFHISSKVRGYLEFPREFPGFMVAVVSAVLMFMADVRMLGLAIIMVSIGLTGQSLYGLGNEPMFGFMVANMLIWSAGMHLFMPLSNTVSLRLAEPGKIGTSLGICNGANNIAYIVGCALIWLLIGCWKLEYSWIFKLAAVSGLLAATCAFKMKKPPQATNQKGFRLVFRKEYTLFYWLNILFGARKQVFLTFAPWVLVKIYHQPPTIIATLLLIASVLGIFLKPWLGRMIDAIGEKKILTAESIILIFVCIGYGYAGHFGLGKFSIYPVYICFIIDNLLMAVTMARTTYLHKNLVKSDDLTPTLSMGITMDHAVAMTIPMLGGILWEALGFEAIFLVAAGIAGINIFAASKMKPIVKAYHYTNLESRS